MYVCWSCVCAVILPVLCAAQADNVTVVWRQLTFDDTHELVINSSIEYILPFKPSPDQRLWPVRVWIRTDGGDTAKPVLVTARRRIGATTWQVPYRSGEAVLFELQRTLCPDDSVQLDALNDLCEDPSGSGVGELSLHVGSSCYKSVTVQLRAAFARDWLIPFHTPVHVQALQGAPAVLHYRFGAEQQNVRMVVTSEDNVCSVFVVQNYTCPISETLTDILVPSLRVWMTVQRSGGVQLSRSNYPRGFIVVVLVSDSDELCRGVDADDDAHDDEWLWEAAVLDAADTPRSAVPPRDKNITITTKAALTRGQYAIAGAATLAVFIGFYVVFGALVFAQRWPRWKRLVGPKAVLAKTDATDDGTRSEVETAMSRRQRRDSTATFDSSDLSDTDDEDEAPPPRPAGDVTRPQVTAPTDRPTGDVTDSRNTGDEGVVPQQVNGTNNTQTQSPERAAAAAASASGVRTAGDNVEMSPQAGGSNAGGARPFGLPERLHVAALARRRGAVLTARSNRYLYTLYTVSLFYALPVVQFVAAFQLILNVSGSLDLCYYNFLCAHPAGGVSDFNHVFSNVGYLLLGALFMLQVRRRRKRRKRKPRDEEYGIPAHYGLLSSLGAAMMMVALLSATYHICPNGLNFQFDTAFMYVLAVLSMVKIYQSRHPDVNARAHATFGVLAVLIALVVWGVLGGGPLFWSVFTVLHVFTFLLLSVRIYYVGQFRLEKESLQMAARSLASLRPLYRARLVMLVIANAVNWGWALYGLFAQSTDFASHLLAVLLCNTLLHMMFYLTMKLLHGERPRWYVWVLLASAAACWAPAIYFFVSGSTDWSTTPALSRQKNHECRVLQFYDSHDLWHMLSAAALYFSFNTMLTWDDGLAAVKRTDIAVF